MQVLGRGLRRGPLIVVVALLLLVGTGTALGVTRPWHHARNAATTQVVTARMTTIVQTVAASGTVAPAKQAGLDFAASGRVTHVKVKAGDVVHKGDVLATVGSSALAAQLAAAAAMVTADEEKVATDSPGSAQLASDEAAVSAARANLHSARAALHDAKLRATINGTVTAVNLVVGQQVNGGSTAAAAVSNGSSAAQVQIQSASSFIVNATVDDTQISEVKKHQDVSVTPEGATAPVAGTVTAVGAVPTSSSGVVSFPVTVALTGHPAQVYPGSSATLTITTSKAVNVLAIPTLAITYNGSNATVQVKSGGGTVTRSITVGQTYGLQTAVKSGLVAGEQVVVTIPTFARIGTNGGTGVTRGNFGGNFGGTSPFGGGGPIGGGQGFSRSFPGAG
ncbi:MAG TPA: biotin/lipoyl-binding protein [Mycobacteriales bacterium]|nr:biotin/lipoyl-binding protein [Mycobacteriales bacterium]